MKKNIHTLSPFLKGSTWNVVKGEGLKAFTLIEMLVSMTIFSVIMVTVMMIYATASDISAKYDINREMRQNIKSLVEDIAEEVRKNEIKWVKKETDLPSWNYKFSNIYWNKLKLVKKRFIDEVNNIEYKIEKSESSLSCSDIKNICTIYKYKNWSKIWPLTNSKISFTNFKFIVSWKDAVPKVRINFTARAAIKNWLRPDLIKNSKLIFQTTISERYLQVK